MSGPTDRDTKSAPAGMPGAGARDPDAPGAPRQRPHLVWTALVAVGVAALAALAWWVWSRPAAESDAEAGAAPAAAPESDAASPAVDADAGGPDDASAAPAARGGAPSDRIADVARAIEDGDFEGARVLLARLEDEFGWSDALDRLTRRLQRREGALRRTIRPLVVHVADLAFEDEGPGEVFALASVAGREVWCTRWFDVEGGRASFTLRTTSQEGFSLRFFESGGFIGGPDALGDAVHVGPLATEGCGAFPLGEAAPFLAAGTVRYEASTFTAGLARDGGPLAVPKEPDAIARALDGALDAVRLVDAEALLARLREAAPGHPDLEFLARETAGLRAARERLPQTARFVVVELGLDPDEDGDLWSSGGDDAELRASIVGADGDAVGEPGGAGLRTWLPPDADAPAENVIEVQARGDEPLRLRVVDTSPTFSNANVGGIDLGVTLADLPDGSGTLALEREPRVLVLPGDDENRVRRVVLRWSVDRGPR